MTSRVWHAGQKRTPAACWGALTLIVAVVVVVAAAVVAAAVVAAVAVVVAAAKTKVCVRTKLQTQQKNAAKFIERRNKVWPPVVVSQSSQAGLASSPASTDPASPTQPAPPPVSQDRGRGRGPEAQPGECESVKSQPESGLL